MKVVAVSGMIGTGKTTLCSALAQRTGWEVVRESPDQNAFLPLFYNDMERWALASQLTFMFHKTLEFERKSKQNYDVILIDRTIQEDLLVFSTVLKQYEILSSEEYALIERSFEFLLPKWAPVDLTIYLEDTDENCYQRLLNRGNAYESKIEVGYVRSLGAEYRNWRDNSLSPLSYKLHPAELDFRQPEKLEPVLQNVVSLLKM